MRRARLGVVGWGVLRAAQAASSWSQCVHLIECNSLSSLSISSCKQLLDTLLRKVHRSLHALVPESGGSVRLRGGGVVLGRRTPCRAAAQLCLRELWHDGRVAPA